MVLCFIGVIGIALGKPMNNDETTVWGLAVALSMSWVYASISVLTRLLKNIHFLQIAFWHINIGIVISVLYFVIFQESSVGFEMSWLLALCCLCDFVTLNA